MQCIGLFYGGSNYAAPNGHDEQDIERFDSLKDAKDAFWRRVDFDPYYPCVDEDTAEMAVYFGTEYHENGPDRVIRLGRGGVKVERG